MKDDLITVCIRAKTSEATDIYAYELSRTNGESLPAFGAGAHIDVHLPNGLVRQYSLCSAPSDRHHYVIAVLRDPQSRGGSHAMHEQVHVGDLIQISFPRNCFALETKARQSLLLAGGIGITPILCMAHALFSTQSTFSLHYSSRSPERMAYREYLARSPFAQHTHLYFDNGSGTEKIDLKAVLAMPESGLHLYVCGPQGFIEAVKATAKAQGWEDKNIHYEYFGKEGSPPVGTSFQVKIASTGEVVTIPIDQTIANALAEKGIEIPVSCEQGVCGTCLTRVVEGTPEHRDQFLTPEEKQSNQYILPCCSRAKTPLLVLDI